MDTLFQIARFLRWRDWGPQKLTILWSLCLFMAVVYELPFAPFAITFVVFFPFAATQFSLGFVLNDWGDRELDRRQFKFNAFNGKSKLEAMLALSLVLVMAIVTGLPLVPRPGFGLLWLAWMTSAVAYALDPLRLKTRGAVGLAASLAAQWLIPVLITFAAFQTAGGSGMWLIALAIAVIGATLELAHQRYDRTRDLHTRATTFAVALPERWVDRIFGLFTLLNQLAVGVFVGVTASAAWGTGIEWAQRLAAGVIGIYLALLLFSLPKVLRVFRGRETEEPYYFQANPARTPTWLINEGIINFAVPVMLGVTASLMNPLYAIVLGAFLVWRVAIGRTDWVWPLNLLRLRIGKQ